MCSQLTHVLVEELPWLPLARLHELYLAGGEADQQHRGLVGGRGGVEVVTGGICALVQLLINRLADVGRLERGAEAVLWINGVLFLLTICASSRIAGPSAADNLHSYGPMYSHTPEIVVSKRIGVCSRL